MGISRDDALAWVRACAAAVSAQRDHLTELDAAIGDGDHGANMHRGFQAVLARASGVAADDIGAIFKAVGTTLVSTVGGAAGPLYGTFFLQLGAATAGKIELRLSDWIAALEAGVHGVMLRGKARLGDKTMVDALVPALERLQAAAAQGLGLPIALAGSAEAAAQGMLATVPLVARKGRASYLGERSAGHQDPGATSAYLLLRAAADTWAHVREQ